MSAVEDVGLISTRSEVSSELAQSAAAAEKQYEIQSAIMVAKRFPRNEDQAFAKLMKSCDRTGFAEDAAYSFPRGKVKNEKGAWVDNYVSGPSVNVAREAARIWGNIRYGLDIIRDDDSSRQIRGWAWDMETNTKVTAEDDFKKLIQRKKDGKTEWVKPDERDLRELTNRRGAVLVRNCILQILPKDLIEDALARSEATMKAGVEKDPEGARKKLILAFSEISVMPDMIEGHLGHPLIQCSPTEIAELRKIYKSIIDGNSTWSEYANTAKEEKVREQGKVDLNALKTGSEQNRGHGNEGLDAVKQGAPEKTETLEEKRKRTAAEAETKQPISETKTENTETAGAPDPEAPLTKEQSDQLDSIRLHQNIEPKTWNSWIRSAFDIKLSSQLRNKHFGRALAWCEAGGQEQTDAKQ